MNLKYSQFFSQSVTVNDHKLCSNIIYRSLEGRCAARTQFQETQSHLWLTSDTLN